MTLRFSLLLPTHNRLAVLDANLRRLTAVAGKFPGEVEIVVADNASTDGTPERVAAEYPHVRLIRLEANRSAAARNVAAARASAPILVMLDDDSYLDAESLRRLGRVMEADAELAAVAARVLRTRPPGRHEGGGLPGVFIGCGAAVRRDVFVRLGGYPEDYDYYVEEYDFCLRLCQAGERVRWYEDIVVHHQRSDENRDTDRMVRFLTRNNLRLWDRYAPPELRQEMLLETVERYARIARKEHAQVGYLQGLTESAHLLGSACGPECPRSGPPDSRPLTRGEFDRVYGLDQARAIIRGQCERLGCNRPAMYGRGKGAEQLLSLMAEIGLPVPVVFDPHYVDQSGADSVESWQGVEVLPATALSRYRPDPLVVGSLSPGACRDLARQGRNLCPQVPVIEPVVWHRSREEAACPA